MENNQETYAILPFKFNNDRGLNNYKKRYSFPYWNLAQACVQFLSDSPFEIGDVVKINTTQESNVFILDVVDPATLSEDTINSLGILNVLSNDIPIDSGSSNQITVDDGDIKILAIESTTQINHVLYLIVIIISSTKGIIRGRDKEDPRNRFEWVIDNVDKRRVDQLQAHRERILSKRRQSLEMSNGDIG